MGEGKWRNLIVESVLSLYCVMAVMVLVPYIFSIGTEQRRAEYGVIAVSLVGGLMLLAVMLAVLRLIGLKGSQNRSRDFAVGVGRALLLFLIGGIVYLGVSLICGVISTFVYGMLNGKADFEIIKGIINCFTGLMVLIIMPFGMAVFWRVIRSDKKFFKAFTEGMRSGVRNYLRLVLLWLAVYGVGIVITTVTNYMETVIWTQLLRVLLIGVCGVVTLNISEKICEKGALR